MEEVEEGGKDKHFFHTETFQFLEEKWHPSAPTVLRVGKEGGEGTAIQKG